VQPVTEFAAKTGCCINRKHDCLQTSLQEMPLPNLSSAAPAENPKNTGKITTIHADAKIHSVFFRLAHPLHLQEIGGSWRSGGTRQLH
jgi:hypothetical protein